MPPAARPGPAFALALALSLLLALAAAAARPLPAGGEATRGAAAGAPGSPFEVEKYLGRWFQVYGSPSVMETFEKGGVCVTADYSLLPDGNIGVFNSQRHLTESGALSNITGYAYIPDAAVPTHLKVHFDTGSPVDGQYWIYSFGPSGTSQYEFAVVSDELKLTLFVLARDPEAFKREFDEDVKALLNALGFKHFWNKPLAVHQGPGCNYPPPAAAVV